MLRDYSESDRDKILGDNLARLLNLSAK